MVNDVKLKFSVKNLVEVQINVADDKDILDLESQVKKWCSEQAVSSK